MTNAKRLALAVALLAGAASTAGWALAETDQKFAGSNAESDTSKVLHKTMKVGELEIFYREAGPKEAPTILLLHGFPTSSQMFRNLIPALD